MCEVSTADDIALFFTDPAVEPSIPGTFSVLYLLRRDISLCIRKRRALWLGAMGTLAGIDLLAKFLAGSDQTRRVGERFRAFIDEYFKPLGSDDAETIYQLRNALLHSFGLYSSSGQKEYRFTVLCEPLNTGLVQSRPTASQYMVNLWLLHAEFEKAIARYKADLGADQGLRDKFGAMFPKYGTTGVGFAGFRTS